MNNDMKNGLIITHEARLVRDVMIICQKVPGFAVIRFDGFTIDNTWRFLVIPRWMVAERVRGMLLNSAICYDTGLEREVVRMVLAGMRDAPAEITYTDEPDDLKRRVAELSRGQAPAEADKTRQSH